MIVNTLLENFDVIAEAPGGVQTTREMILQLAVRGKLVPQDCSDGPTPSNDRQLVTGIEDGPYSVPESWRWVRLGTAMNLVNGRAFKPADWSRTGVPIIRIQNLNNETAPFNYCSFDVPAKFYVDNEDLLLSWSGTPGTSFGAFVWRRGRAVLNQHIFRCEVSSDLYLNDFARLAINARLSELIAQAHGGVGLQHVTKGKLDRLLIVLPPLAEQRRIVAKVGELMSLCDQLEKRQWRRSQLRTRANRSVLHHLATSGNDEELAAQWYRLCENFRLIYDTPDAMAELRQAVLELAVRGKLVAQDPTDEPAGVLLERIATDREQNAKIKDGRQVRVRSGLGVPFDLPSGWEWARFSDVANIASNLVDPSEHQADYHVAPDNIEKGTGRLLGYRTVAEDGVRSANHQFYPGQILYSKIRPNLSKVVVVGFGGLCSADMYPINALISARYLLDYMLSATFLGMAVSNDTRVAMPKINQAELSKLLVPVPPLAEQERISTRVDELLALCRELEARLARARDRAEHLAASVVHRLSAA